MALFYTGPTLDNAPCPPLFVDDIYTIFISVATNTTLTKSEIEEIRVRCNIAIPTTTTTTTTTTTPPPTTTTTPPPTTTTIPPPTTIPSSLVPTGTTVGNTTSNISTSKATTTLQTAQTTTTNVVTTPPSTQTTKNTTTTAGPTFFPNTTTSFNVTTINGTAVTEKISSAGCGDMCLLVLATIAVFAFCLLMILLAAVIATLFRKGREERKKERGRSPPRHRSMADLPDTAFYDSIGAQETEYGPKGVMLRHNSSDYTRTQAFLNPAYRRSDEFRTSYYGDWYDQNATDFEYSQTMANLTVQKSRSPERRSLPRTPLGERRVAIMPMGQTNHVSLREYVPKSILNGKIPSAKNNPYQAQNGQAQTGVRNKSPSRRSLPRTPIERRKNVLDTEQIQKQRPSYRRSASYDPYLSHESKQTYDHELDFLTMNNRNRDSNKRYVKHSQRSNNNPQQNRRDNSTKGKLHKQNGSDVNNGRVLNYGISPDYDFENVDAYRQKSFVEPKINSLTLRPGSYYNGSHNMYEDNTDGVMGIMQRGHSRSRKDRTENHHSRKDRGYHYPPYRALPKEDIYVLHQTKL